MSTPAPATVNLTAAAMAVLRTDRGSERSGAMMVWYALTGIRDQGEALAYAHQVAEHPTTAAVIPF